VDAIDDVCRFVSEFVTRYLQVRNSRACAETFSVQTEGEDDISKIQARDCDNLLGQKDKC